MAHLIIDDPAVALGMAHQDLETALDDAGLYYDDIVGYGNYILDVEGFDPEDKERISEIITNVYKSYGISSVAFAPFDKESFGEDDVFRPSATVSQTDKMTAALLATLEEENITTFEIKREVEH